MKTLLLSLAFLSLLSVSPALAGGDPDQLGTNMYGDASVNTGVTVGTGTSMTTDPSSPYDGDASNTPFFANTFTKLDSATTLQVILVMIIVGGAAGLLYWAYRRNKVI